MSPLSPLSRKGLQRGHYALYNPYSTTCCRTGHKRPCRILLPRFDKYVAEQLGAAPFGMAGALFAVGSRGEYVELTAVHRNAVKRAVFAKADDSGMSRM